MSIRWDEPVGADTMEPRRMSLEEFQALPEDIRAEYVDGVALMAPPRTPAHNRAARWIANAIEEGCPALFVATESGVTTRPSRRRIPDVYALASPESDVFSGQVPVVVVEVLSPSTRTEDTVRKSQEYAELGVGQYWIVDREHRRLTVLANNGQGWDVVAELAGAQPKATVAVDGYGTIDLDLMTLMRD